MALGEFNTRTFANSVIGRQSVGKINHIPSPLTSEKRFQVALGGAGDSLSKPTQMDQNWLMEWPPGSDVWSNIWIDSQAATKAIITHRTASESVLNARGQ